MTTRTLTPEEFESKLDDLILAAIEVTMLRAPDGIIRAIDRLVKLRRELVEHDATVRAEDIDTMIARMAGAACAEEPFQLDEAALQPVPPPAVRHHAINCVLERNHVGLCSSVRPS